MANTPFTGSGLYKLRSGSKIQLPENLRTYATWCVRGDRITCLGMVLEEPCLTIFPPKFYLWRERTLNELGAEELNPASAGGHRARLLRVLARSRPLTISADGLLGIPRDTAERALLPPEEASVEVVAYAEIIELWDPSRFLESATADAKRLPDLLRQAGVDLP